MLYGEPEPLTGLLYDRHIARSENTVLENMLILFGFGNGWKRLLSKALGTEVPDGDSLSGINDRRLLQGVRNRLCSEGW